MNLNEFYVKNQRRTMSRNRPYLWNSDSKTNFSLVTSLPSTQLKVGLKGLKTKSEDDDSLVGKVVFVLKSHTLVDGFKGVMLVRNFISTPAGPYTPHQDAVNADL